MYIFPSGQEWGVGAMLTSIFFLSGTLYIATHFVHCVQSLVFICASNAFIYESCAFIRKKFALCRKKKKKHPYENDLNGFYVYIESVNFI